MRQNAARELDETVPPGMMEVMILSVAASIACMAGDPHVGLGAIFIDRPALGPTLDVIERRGSVSDDTSLSVWYGQNAAPCAER